MFYSTNNLNKLGQFIVDLVYKYNFVTKKQILQFRLPNFKFSNKNLNYTLNELMCVNHLIKEYKYFNTIYYTPISSVIYKNCSVDEELMALEKSLDLFVNIYIKNHKQKDNIVTHIIEHHPVYNMFPINISFVVEQYDINEPKDKEYSYYDILYIPLGHEGNANFLAQRIIDNDEVTSNKIVIVDEKEQKSKIKIDDVVSYYLVNHLSGTIEQIGHINYGI